MKTRDGLAMIIALSVAGGIASAEEHVFYANISGDNEVPSNSSPALGFMAGVYDDVANTFSFNWVITDNLIGEPAAPGAHIHNAPAGENGPIVFGFSDGDWDLDGSAVWEDLSQDNIDALFASELYINFHTTEFPGGEVRGQIVPVPAPGAMALAGFGLLAMSRRRR